MRIGRAALIVLLPVAACASGQDTPEGALRAFYDSVENQEYSAACEIIEPELRQALVAFSGPCPNMVAEEFGDLRDVEIDASRIRVTGDIARVSAEGITAEGVPIDDEGLSLAKIDGKWYISGQ